MGRDIELATLRALLHPGGPLVVYVHGMGGIGKSSLVAAFARQLTAEGHVVLTLDCRAIEPTERGLLEELAAALGAREPTLAALVRHLDAGARPLVLALDAYESFRLLDTWLRQVFIPALPEHVRLILAGREAPLLAWFTADGWHGLFRSLTLGPLPEPDALALATQSGLAPEQAARINRFARGHPLALRLALAAGISSPELPGGAAVLQKVLEQLTRLYLEQVPDRSTRRALQAASVTRRTTRGLLQTLLPDADPDDAFERLRALPFIELGRDGLLLHDVVRQALAADLQASDPATYRAYRQAAWAHLRAELVSAARPELWRYTADMLYLLEHPAVREVFFPSDSQWFAIELAAPEDWAAIAPIVLQHNGPENARLIGTWWQQLPRSFQVVRDDRREVIAFSCLFEHSDARPAHLQADPITRVWEEHLRRHPVAARERVLFHRHWLSRDHGEGPCPEQAAIFLDIKRLYMELRPQLRRIYVLKPTLPAYTQSLRVLGFGELPEATAHIDGVAYGTMMLDFGHESIDGWLGGLVGAQLAAQTPAVVVLDVEGHELLVDGQRVTLTQLELGVMRYLVDRAGQAVPRGDLLEDVWGYSYEGASNVVDVVIATLRKKLGPRAAVIETVPRVGYRFRLP
ncbi:MAG: AAA family ATPase [Chloroflexales bacterium]|nr:AAA family ATPase [Chloroflexales bacterium]